MKKILFVLIGIILSLFLCSCNAISNNGIFEDYKCDFETINNIILSIDLKDNQSTYLVTEGAGENREIYEFPIELDENQLHSLNNIANAFTTDFSFIKITETRISYGGEGSDMFVYSKDGRKPKYFYSKGDKIDFSIENLGDNWYFCHARIR